MSITRARSLRRKMSPAEAMLWTALRSAPLKPFHFRRQVPFGPYYADFAAHGPRLIVEIDGSSHFDDAAIAYDARRDAFLVSPDGLRVRFGLAQGAETPVEFDIRTGVLKPSPSAPADFTEPRTDGLPVERWENQPRPTLAGETLGAFDAYRWKAGESSRALAIDARKSVFVLGTDLHLRAYHADGRIAWTRSGRATCSL